MKDNHSNRQEAKSNREIKEVEALFRALAMVPNSLKKGPDPPDVVATLDNRIIGIENTAFHTSGTIKILKNKEVSQREMEAAWENLSDCISRLREQSYNELDDIRCLLYFSDHHVPSASHHKQFAEELCLFVQSKAPSLLRRESFFSEFSKADYPLLASSLRKILAKKVRCYITWQTTLMGGSVGVHEHELLSTCGKKLAWDRPEGFDEAWLLIVSNYRTSETMGIVTVEDLKGFVDFNEKLSHGPFDKVYIHQPGFGQLLLWEDKYSWSDKGEVVKWL